MDAEPIANSPAMLCVKCLFCNLKAELVTVIHLFQFFFIIISKGRNN